MVARGVLAADAARRVHGPHAPRGRDGRSPRAELLLGSDGDFYGITSAGGTSASPGFDGFGTVFRMT